MSLRIIASAAAIAALLAAAPVAHAASSAASSASDSVTTSVGSASGSIKRSSDSSSRGTGVAEGDYRIIEMASVAEQPGMLRMKLQPAADVGPNTGADGEFFLYLPRQTVAQSLLAQGDIVTARQRPYGVEFAGGQGRQAFFLVLDDDWFRELQSRPVVL